MMRAAAPLLAALVLAGAACSTSAAGEGPQVERTAGSEPEASLEEVEVDSTARSASTTDDSDPGTVPAPPHPVVTDNRVYVVGDSISESIASRYSGLICEALGPLGWDVVVDAVQGRRTDQAIRSLRRNQSRVGQTVMVLIGHNDGIDPEGYRERIEQLIDLVPDARRILLLTNYEFERGRDRMNDVLREMAAVDGDGGPDDRLQLVDWNAAVEEIDDAIQRDGIHLTDSGQRALVTVMAAALGAGPDQGGLPGEPSCTTLRDSDRVRRLGIGRLGRIRWLRPDDDNSDAERLERSTAGHRATTSGDGRSTGHRRSTAHRSASERTAPGYGSGTAAAELQPGRTADQREGRLAQVARFHRAAGDLTGGQSWPSGPRPRGRRGRRARGSGSCRGCRT